MDYFDLAQTVGIVISILYTAFSLRKSEEQRRIGNYIDLVQGHRDIWSMVVTNPSLERITFDDVDLDEHPITVAERYFVSFIIFHLTIAYLMRKHRAAYPIENLAMDIGMFLSLPIPAEVWKTIAPYQNKEVKAFVEESIKKHGASA